jgi:ABC-type glycerol-3-phosphate transport system substrate-binding protein
MKKIFLSLLFSGIILTGFAQSKNTAVAKADGTFPLVVSFTSRSSGPDAKGLKRIIELIETNEKKYKKPIAHNVASYGREGETEYSFDLVALSKKQKKKFIALIKKEMATYQVVYVSENVEPIATKMKRKSS